MKAPLQKPNFLLITSDHHRWDFMSCVNGPVQTPALDRLAANGTRIEHAYCQAPVCVPSRIAITTGRYPMNTGNFTNRHPIDSALPSFVRELRNSGVHTALIGKLHHHVHSMGYDYQEHREEVHRLGFDHVHETSGKRGAGAIHCECDYTAFLREEGLLDTYREWTGRWGDGKALETMTEPWRWDPETTQDTYIARKACEFLRQQPVGHPFYLQLGFVGPHPAFDAPEIYRAGFKDPAPANPDAHPDWWPAYLACIREVDAQIGRVLKTLEEQGLAENTYVIYTSDHGDLAGDHGLWGKVYLYEGSVHVPFIVRGPGIPQRRISNALVELIDIGSTISDALGVRPHHWDQGKSLMPLLRGLEDSHRETVFTEMGSDKMLFDGRYKLIYGDLALDRRKAYSKAPHNGPAFGRPVNLPPDGIALFDLETDPRELDNLAEDPEHRDLLHRMERKLLHRMITNCQAAREDTRSVM